MIIQAAHRFLRTTEAILADVESAPVAPEAPAPVQEIESIDRDEAIARIKAGLKARTGKSWSVTGGRGTSWGWITISAPPKRQPSPGAMSEADRFELATVLGEKVHHQGVSIPAGNDYRVEYVDRAEGREPRRLGTPYWD